MSGTGLSLWLLLAAAVALLLQGNGAFLVRERIVQHRNLGKAFYENPTTHFEAVEEFRKALELAPDSARERVNYGLALLRAGKTDEGVAELEKAQKQDPRIPHTWFNLGITFKKASQYERAAAQFEQMVRLVPDEPVSRYNLGVLHKLTGKSGAALEQFETSARLDPNLAGPRFQLFNAYRQLGRAKEAAREEAIFKELKKRQAGAAVPEDLEWSFYAEVYETIEPSDAQNEAPPNPLKMRAERLGEGFDPATAGLTTADVDGNGRADVIAWSSRGVRVFRAGPSGLESLRNVLWVEPGDFNDDGLADLAIITPEGASLFANQKGSFKKQAAVLPTGSFARALWLDYDHDYDLDLFLLGASQALARNNGSAGFSDESGSFPFVKGRASAAVMFDTVPDTDVMDLVVAYADRPGVLYRDKLAGKYEAQELPAVPAGSTHIAAYDLNNDSWTDLAAAGASKAIAIVNREGKFEPAAALDGAAGPLAFADFENRGAGDLVVAGSVYRNQGFGKLVESRVEGLRGLAAAAPLDFDEDGRVDLAIVTRDGAVEVLRNESETSNAWLRAALVGVKNLKLAYGSKVEVKAGLAYQKQTYRGVPLQFGLRSYKQAETVRITWPNGLVQNEIRQAAAKVAVIKEAPRLSGSCPMIFTWNGREFEFITDVLGVAPLGASAGDGEYFPVDHDEYVQIPAGSLAERDGEYEVRITEELREVSYIDQARLIAVDHPAAIEIFTNDKFKAPPFPEFRLFGVGRRIYPASARDHRGANVLDRIARRDRTYADGFARDYTGVAEMHYLDLDFGAAAADNRAVLILNGWVDWADGSTFRALAQERPAGLVLPYLQVKDGDGRWRTVIEDMGIPAGKPKTIAVDLTGKFLSRSREARIVTNLCLYWDEIFLTEEPGAPEATLTGVGASRADLRFRGFSRPVIHPLRKQPERFVYGEPRPVSSWNPTPGNYTRYGDVRELLESADDRMTILGSGDELRLHFDARRFPPLARGWKRDFLLLIDGWAKDADANTAFSTSVEPLPFHGMSAYPYPPSERFPDGDLHMKYREQYNTRPALRLLRPLTEKGGS